MAEESVSSRRASTRAKKAAAQGAPAVKERETDGDALGKVNGHRKKKADTPARTESKDEVTAQAVEPRQLWRVKAMLVLYTTLLLMGFGLSLASDLSRLVPTLLKLSLALQIVATIFFVLVGKDEGAVSGSSSFVSRESADLEQLHMLSSAIDACQRRILPSQVAVLSALPRRGQVRLPVLST